MKNKRDMICEDGRGASRFIQYLVRYKIYIDRARAYVGYIQFLMLAVILAKQFGFKLGLFGSILLVVGFFVGCLIVGFIDTKIGIRAEEAHNYNQQNPEIKEIIKQLNELKNNSCNSCKG